MNIPSVAAVRSITPQRPTGYIVSQPYGSVNLYGATALPIKSGRIQSPKNHTQMQTSYYSQTPTRNYSQNQFDTTTNQRSSVRSPGTEYGINLYEKIRDGSVESNQTIVTGRYSENLVKKIDGEELSRVRQVPSSPYRPFLERDASKSPGAMRSTPIRSQGSNQMIASVPSPMVNSPARLQSREPVSIQQYRPLVQITPINMIASGVSHTSAFGPAMRSESSRYTPTRLVANVRDSSTSIYLGEAYTYNSTPTEDLQETLTKLQAENNQLKQKIEATQQEKSLALSLNMLLLRKLANLNHLDEPN
jgi:hypothetical protein